MDLDEWGRIVSISQFSETLKSHKKIRLYFQRIKLILKPETKVSPYLLQYDYF